MKKFIFSIILALCALPALAQLNIQVHYDFGEAIYGQQLSNRPHWVATIENFTPDKWGSTFFFVDMDYAHHEVSSAYWEIAREFNMGSLPFSLHLEYNGGLN
ncbi:MAG: DUF5020 family protein, partial [Bacteroidaceae bacterium]|nr:DUF5020 family protein [Bacteroidaceae bacterium]